MCKKGTLRITPHSCSALNRTSISPPPRPRKHCEGGGRETEFLATACDMVIATTDKTSRGYLHKKQARHKRQGRREGTGYEEELQEWWRRKGNGGKQE